MHYLLEMQVAGEPPTKGDALDWASAIHSVLTEDQQRRVRETVRTMYARRHNRTHAAVGKGGT